MGQQMNYLDYITWAPDLTHEERVDRGPFQAEFAIGLVDRAPSAVTRARRAKEDATYVDEVVLTQAVFALLLEDQSVRQIAQALDVPKSTVGRIVKRFDRDSAGRLRGGPTMPLATADLDIIRRAITDAWDEHPEDEAVRRAEQVDAAALETLLCLVGPATVHLMEGPAGRMSVGIADNFGRVLDWLWSAGRRDRAVLLVADLLSAVRDADLSPQPSYETFMRMVRLSLTSDEDTQEALTAYVDDHITGYYANAKTDPA